MSDTDIGWAIMVAGLLFLAGYFLPWIIARWRKHNRSGSIFLVNLLAGWTGIAWILAFIWALSKIEIKMKKCPNCSEEIQDNALFCKYCNWDFTAKNSQITIATKSGSMEETIQQIVSRYGPTIIDDKIFFHPKIPQDMMQNVLNTYAIGVKPNTILALIDNTNHGLAKDGGILTTTHLIFHNMWEDPKSIALNSILSVAFQEGVISSNLMINGISVMHSNFPSKPAMHLFAQMLNEIVITMKSRASAVNPPDATIKTQIENQSINKTIAITPQNGEGKCLCPFCKEEIKEGAIKCKHCGSILQKI